MFPAEYTDVGTVTVNVTDTEQDGCLKAVVNNVRNPQAFTVTGSFQLYTEDPKDKQLLDVNWHFGTLVMAEGITEFSDARAKWAQTVVDTNDDNDFVYDSIHSYNQGRWNNPGNRTFVDFVMVLSKGLRPHDQVVIKAGGFDASVFSACYSILLGDGIFESLYSGWGDN